MIPENIYQKWLFFINHFNMMANRYRQMSFAAGTGNGDMKGFAKFFDWESHERWNTHDWLAKTLGIAGREVKLTTVTLPNENFTALEPMVTAIKGLETATLNEIKAAIDIAVVAKDYYSENVFRKLFTCAVEEHKEVSDVHKKVLQNGSDVAAMQDYDHWLFNQYWREKKYLSYD